MTIPFIKQNKVTPDVIKTFAFDDFSGGINNRTTTSLLKPNEAFDMLNMAFVSDSGVEKRFGTENCNVSDFKEPIVYMDTYKPINKDEVMILATATGVYAGGTKIATVSNTIHGANYVGNYFFVDGNKIFQYDGTKVYEIKQPTESRLDGSTLINVLSFKVSSWDSRIKVGLKGQIEGIEGTNLFTIASFDESTKTITVSTATTIAFATNTLVRFYQPLVNSYTEGLWKVDETLNVKWYEPCVQELNDSNKGECYMPKNCTCIQLDSERIYMAGDREHPNEIYISDINNPFYFPVSLGLQCPPNGDKIKDLIQFDNAIVVCRSNDIHVIYGETADTTTSGYFYMKKFDTHTGVASINNAKLANNYMFYLGSDMNAYGMHSVLTSSESLATTMLNKDKVDLTKAPFGFTYADITNVPSIYFEDEYLLIIKDTVVVYNYIKRAWSRYKGINASYFLVKDNILLIGTTDGRVLKRSANYNDCGVAIDAYYRIGQQNFDSPIYYKNFLDMYAVTHAYDDYESSVRLLALVDYNEVKSEAEIFNDLSRFGVSCFGETLIAMNIAQTDDIPVDLRGKIFSFIFSNNELDEPMKIYQIAGTYVLRGTR